jgi:DNA-binding MarR family transcriptional regulator
LPSWKYSKMEIKDSTREDISDHFAELLQRLLRSHPKLVFPDERLSRMQQQIKSLRGTSLRNPEDRMFLFRILFALRDSESPPTMGELSAELEIPLSSATRMADGLVRAKLVQRRPDAKDRRVVRLCITENGRRFVEEGKGLMKQRIAQLLLHFSADEQEQLLRLLGKLIDSLQAERR